MKNTHGNHCIFAYANCSPFSPEEERSERAWLQLKVSSQPAFLFCSLPLDLLEIAMRSTAICSTP
jgi:hypothetical protein